MLFTNLLPLLSRYSLNMDVMAAPDGAITLTIIPRKADSKAKAEHGEARPISITATAEEIDAEMMKGWEGALGRLFVARKALADQIAEQHAAAEAAKVEAAKAAKPKNKALPAPSKPPENKALPAPAATEPKPGEPVSLWAE
jgi:PRTRC genetic system protein E